MKLNVIFPLGRVVYPGETFAGKGTFNALRYLNGDRFCVVISNSLYLNSEVKLKMGKIFKKGFVKYVIPKSGEPILDEVNKLIQDVNDFKPDWIIALGGGSVIDCAKILWVKYEYLDIKIEDLTRPFYIKSLRMKSNFAAIPTTSGTGSEVSSTAVFKEDNLSPKSFLISHELIPDIVILDPDFLNNLPTKQKVYSTFDAIAHAIEGYVSPYRNQLLCDYSVLALSLIFSNFENYVNSIDDDSSYAILRAANLAGYVQNIAIPGIGHAFSHYLSGYGIQHGKACALSIIPSIIHNAKNSKCEEQYSELGNRLGLAGLDGLIDKLNFYLTLFDITLEKSVRVQCLADENIQEKMLNDPTFRGNPIEVNLKYFLSFI